LELLRRCLPARIRQALEELPESLDGTYERILQDIDKANWKFAHRIFQCVAVASRPLRVEALADFLAFDFDAGPTPTYRPGWRPGNPACTILSTCSTLLAVVKVRDSEVIQFSHFSVKEFLTSARLAEANDTISRYHVSLTAAHTLVAQACLGILLHLDENITNDRLKNFPLVKYAAKHLVDHVRFEDVPASIQDGMKRLFDPRMGHFAVWLWIFDPRRPWIHSQRPPRPSHSRGRFLHYAALFGLHYLIPFLVIECRQEVNASGFDYNGTPLHVALRGGHVKFARVLLEHGADVNAQDDYKSTPLHVALKDGQVGFARVLLEHGADFNSQDYSNSTSLHLSLKCGHVEFARTLVEYGADVNAQDILKSTPLHLAVDGRHVEFAQVLVEHGADVNAQGFDKSTPLHLASQGGHVELVRVLIEHGAIVNAQDDSNSTPLRLALMGGHVELARVLLEHGADVLAQDVMGLAPFQRE